MDEMTSGSSSTSGYFWVSYTLQTRQYRPLPVSQEGQQMRAKGRIRLWNDQKGFGFIEPANGGKQVFIHISAFSNRNRTPRTGEWVSYALSTDKEGRPCAARATLPGDILPKRRKGIAKASSIIGAILFLGMLGISVAEAKLPPAIFGLYLVASAFTFVMYAMDKSAAKRGAGRTRESTLHGLSLIGGWPGALIAQQTLRHKSSKQSFRAEFWITVALNVGALAWMFTPEGLAMVQSWIDEGRSLSGAGRTATIEWAEPR